METQSLSEDLRRYLVILWHWAWLILLAAIVGGGTAYIFTKRIPPTYQASTTVRIIEAPSAQVNDYYSLYTSERLAQTYAELLTKSPVLQGVIDRLGLGISPSVIKQRVTTKLVESTTLIEINVTDSNPEQAAEIANTIVTIFAEQNQAAQASRYASSKQSLEEQLATLEQQIQETSDSLTALGTNPNPDEAQRNRLEIDLSQYRNTYSSLLQSYEEIRLAEAQSTSNVVQVEPAVAPKKPIGPKVLNNTLLAVAAGIIIAGAIAILIETLDDTLRDPEDVSRLLGLPVLGIIARHETNGDSPVTVTIPRGPVAEAFRALRTNVQFASVDKPLHSLLVTSPSPSDGKSTVAVNLAMTIAQNERKVVLLDADLRRPKIHKYLKLSNRHGMSDLFVQPQVSLQGSIQSSSQENLVIMTSGPLPPNPSELLGSEKMAEILHQICLQADIVIIDTPPLLAVTDGTVLAPRADGVLLVIKPGVTKMAACRQAVDQLRRVGANLLGVVLNEVEIKNSRYYYYRYKGYYNTYYDYHYGDETKPLNGAHKKDKKRKKPVEAVK